MVAQRARPLTLGAFYALTLGGIPYVGTEGTQIDPCVRPLSAAERFALQAAVRTAQNDRGPDGPSPKTLRRRAKRAQRVL